MSAQDLADACDDLDHPIPRNVIANLESGRRLRLTVPDLLVLAKALDIPPLWLLFPLDHDVPVEPLPGDTTDTWSAFTWATGEDDPKHARSLDAFRQHQQAKVVLEAQLIRLWREEAYGPTDTPETVEALLRTDEQAAQEIARLYHLRTLMRHRGLALPELPPQLEFLDNRPPFDDTAREGI